MIQDMFDGGAMPSLERLIQFTGARHSVLQDNIANLSTPYYKSKDLDPGLFQESLRKAIDRRRHTPTPVTGPLTLTDSVQIKFKPNRIEIRPQVSNDGILFHDQNNRDLERIMQHLVENTMTHNAAIEMLRNEFDMLRLAIRERI